MFQLRSRNVVSGSPLHSMMKKTRCEVFHLPTPFTTQCQGLILRTVLPAEGHEADRGQAS
eukprot:3126162-Rhodomonas_salina.5